jgi:regulator of sigma E protease
MDILITAVAFILIFSVLILVHEWGHFFFARKAGIKVEEFGIGLPPRAKKLFKDKKGTIYSLNWIPFGGYVRLYGEDSSDPKVLKAKNSFASKSILRRTSVIVAGVVMNFVLAWVLITIGFMVGMKPFLVTDNDLMRAQAEGLIDVRQVLYIHEVSEDSPLASTGIQAGDLVVEVNSEPVPMAEDLPTILGAGEMVNLSVLHGEQISSVWVAPTADGKLGFTVSDSPYILYLKDQQYPFYKAPVEAVKEVGRLSYLTLSMLGDVITGLLLKFTVPEGVAGPVGIARMTHHFTQQGLMALMQFTALLSISLGVINIMPFPALDGGRFLFIIFEIITRKKPSARWEAMIHAIGFALLMLLILVITWNDIMSFF